MEIKTKHNISDTVYFNLDKEQNPMYIISIWVKKEGTQYECRDVHSATHYYSEFELSSEQNILTKIK